LVKSISSWVSSTSTAIESFSCFGVCANAIPEQKVIPKTTFFYLHIANFPVKNGV